MTKILVIRFSSIGDIVLTSPILRCIKSQLDNVELHVLTKKQYSHLYEPNPNVDKVHAWGEDDKKVLSILKKESFDYVVDLHKNIRTARVKSYLSKKSYSFPKLNVQKWLIVNFKWNLLPNIHIVDRYFKAVEPLGVKNDQKGLDFYIQNVKKTLKTRFDVDKEYIVVAIGGKFATKKMPAEKLSEVLSKMALPIVLIGGQEDREEGQKIKEYLPEQDIDNTCGEFSIHESAQVVKDAAILITHDTGMMHIGSAFDVPIVSIWGSTIPEFGMYPYRPQSPESYSIHEVKGLSCRPCSKLGYDKCPKGHFKCMMDQDIPAIRAQILKFLKSDINL